ncbi:MAG TPA: hypothetical protein VGM64_18835 [Lacunisphaera sp.]
MFSPPPGYNRIKIVADFRELVETPFRDGVNALCWERALSGDFGEIVGLLDTGDGITAIDDEHLLALRLTSAGQIARTVIFEDLHRLRTQGLAPELNCIQSYPRDNEGGTVRTDVYSFHADSAPVATDTFLCTYLGAASEGLRNDEARRRIDVPETRAELLAQFGGAEDDDFRAHLHENCYDLHYAPLARAQPFNFGLGNFWRIAVDSPDSPVPPCIHRAPDNLPGQLPRLLLIS